MLLVCICLLTILHRDIDSLCHDICPLQSQSCGGRVLRCLTDKFSELQSKECSDEVFYFLKMEVNDFRNDIILAEACRTDVERYCKNVQPGRLGDDTCCSGGLVYCATYTCNKRHSTFIEQGRAGFTSA